MKVLIYGNELFSIDMQWGFQQLGHDVKIINSPSPGLVKNNINSSGAELLITLGAPLELNQEVLSFLGNARPSGMKLVHWDTDGISSTYYDSISGDGIEMDVIYPSKPDLVLTMCPEMREFVIDKGFRCLFMHYGYSPVMHHPIPELWDEEHRYFNLIGNPYTYFYHRNPGHYRYHSMKILLKPLLENGYDVQVFGDREYLTTFRTHLGIAIPPQRLHPYIPYTATCAGYNNCFMNIVTQNHRHTITKRTFEILASGGFALSADSEELRKYFKPGRDLAVSSSPEETLYIARYYMDHLDEWREVRKNALLAVEGHSYKHRAAFILDEMKKL